MLSTLRFARRSMMRSPGFALLAHPHLLAATDPAMNLVASWLPARRTARSNPIEALRAESV
jgi:hypothetical protein